MIRLFFNTSNLPELAMTKRKLKKSLFSLDFSIGRIDEKARVILQKECVRASYVFETKKKIANLETSTSPCSYIFSTLRKDPRKSVQKLRWFPPSPQELMVERLLLPLRSIRDYILITSIIIRKHQNEIRHPCLPYCLGCCLCPCPAVCCLHLPQGFRE